jgi:glycosidase
MANSHGRVNNTLIQKEDSEKDGTWLTNKHQDNYFKVSVHMAGPQQYPPGCKLFFFNLNHDQPGQISPLCSDYRYSDD